MIAELSQRPLMRPGGPWRWRLSVGANISYLETAATATDQKEDSACATADASVSYQPWEKG